MTAEQTPIDKATYVVIDLETTGLDHRSEQIIEIGAVKMNGRSPSVTFEQLINPNRLIPPTITKLTGITNDMIYNAPDIDSILPAFVNFVGDSTLVFHNASFDISFLNRAARKAGLKSFRNRFFDTKLIAQKLRPLLGFYRLANLAEHFNVPYRPNHRALPDALATAEVFSHLLEIMKSEGLDTLDKALDFFYPKKRHDFEHKISLAKNLPKSSGVYLMKNRYGNIIYVGKSKDINKRVRSYFYAGSKTERQLSLLSDVEKIDHIKTGTEIGALLLESKLIKKLKPEYNVLGKRYRRHPFVRIDYEDDFPTPKIVRKVAPSGFYYGPFSNTTDLELLLEVAKDLYGLKQCDYKIKPGKKMSPCFYYQANRCTAPCAGMITKEDYKERLVAVMDAFDGRPDKLRNELIRRRDIAAGNLRFEKAALINRSLNSLDRIAKLLEGIRDARANLDFILIEEIKGMPRVYLIANGQLKSCIDLKNNEKYTAKLLRKITKIYFIGKDKTQPYQISAEQIENLSLLTAYFHKRPVKKIKIGNSPTDTLKSLFYSLSSSSNAHTPKK
ncbi:MAG: 3'-5' exoribonuclease [Firmicutes bacterium]|nr:3'-5' exoribonuclease [Bacillota bacterium]